MANSVLQYSPGQLVSSFIETINSQGERADGYELPIVQRIIFPNLSLAANYPAFMQRLDTGLYRSQFTLPMGASAIGSYLIDISYADPDTSIIKQTFIQVIVLAPLGNYSASLS